MGGTTGSNLPDLELANFRFLGLLGSGGMGKVYLAEQLRPRRQVAIKVVQPDDEVPPAVIRVLQEEGDIAAQFDHEHVIRVIECGIVDGAYYLVMQYLPGGDLAARIGEGLTHGEARRIIRTVASGLGAIHERGFVHRDIKPGNILFTVAGKPVLADFGIAKRGESAGMLTSLGYSIGSPAYMSPEQIRNEPLDARSDLYSLGAVLYEMLAGRPPFHHGSEHELKQAHLEEPVPQLPQSAKAFQPIVNRLLAKDAGGRFSSAAELIEALDALEIDEAVETATAPAETSRARAPAGTSVTMWFRELKRRRVIRTAAIYVALAWGFTEIAITVAEAFEAPGWIGRAIIITFVAGFPVVLALAWAYDLRVMRSGRVPGQTRPSPRAFVGVGMLAAFALAGLGLSTAWWSRQPAVDRPPVIPEQGPKTVAVLPFRNLTGDESQAHVAEGLTDEVIFRLSGIEGIQLVSPGSARQFGDAELDARDIAAELGSDLLVQGNVQIHGTRMKVKAQLVNGETGLMEWQDAFDERVVDAIHIQEQIAREIASELYRQLATGDVDPESIDAEVRDLYMLAEHHLANRYDSEAINRAVELLERVTLRAPDFAEGWARLSLAYLFSNEVGNQTIAAVGPRAREAAETALELNPRLADAHFAYAKITKFWHPEMSDEERKEVVAQHVERAIQLDPNHPEAREMLGDLYFEWRGDRQRGIEEYKKALELEPGSVHRITDLAWGYYWMNELDRALELGKRAVRADPGNPGGYRWVARVHQARGELAEAIAATREALEADPEGATDHAGLGRMLLSLGFQEEADAAIARAYELAPHHPVVQRALFLATVRAERWGALQHLLSQYRRLLQEVEGSPHHFFTAWAEVLLGNHAAAREDLKAIQVRDGHAGLVVEDQGLYPVHLLAWIDMENGSTTGAQALLEQTAPAVRGRVASAVGGGPETHALAVHYALLGEPKKALEYLELAIERGWRDLWLTRRLPMLDSLKDLPQFQELDERLAAILDREREEYTNLAAADAVPDVAAR